MGESVFSSDYLLFVSMNVAPEGEEIFNEIYDHEHVPVMLSVPGMLSCVRYVAATEGDPQYLASIPGPKYMSLYGMASEDLPTTEVFIKAMTSGEWPVKVRPHLRNGAMAVFKRITTGSEYREKHLFVVIMDVEPAKEAAFNEIYDEEHIPMILKVPGVLSATRYQTSAETKPKYLALYEVEDPMVPTSEAFVNAADTGRWAPEIRPHTYNRRHIIYKPMSALG